MRIIFTYLLILTSFASFGQGKQIILVNVNPKDTIHSNKTVIIDSPLYVQGVKVGAGVGSGSVTSISQGHGIVSTPNPLTITGTIKVDTATLYPEIRSTIPHTNDSLPYYLPRWLSAILYQPLLGFTAENITNKVTTLIGANNTTYPTTQAVLTALGADTINISNRINQKAAYTDTLTTIATRAWSLSHFLQSFTETDPLSFHSIDSNTHSNAITYDYYYAHLPTITTYSAGYGLSRISTVFKWDSTIGVSQTHFNNFWSTLGSNAFTSTAYYPNSNPNGYTSNLGTVTSVGTNYPLTGGNITTTGSITIPKGTTHAAGYIDTVDWQRFYKDSGTVWSVTAGAGLSGGIITSSGTISLPNTGTAGTYGDGTHIPSITTDAQGRITVVATYTISAGATYTNAAPITLSGVTYGFDYTYAGAFTVVQSFAKGITVYSATATPSTPASGFQLYAGPDNTFRWKGQNGFVRTFDGTANTADRAYVLPDHACTIDNLTTSTTSTAGYAKGLSGNLTFITTIPNSDLTNNSITANGTIISLGGSATITAAAGTLTGTTLNSTVVTSSLTSVGTITSGLWNGTRLTSSYIPTNVGYVDLQQAWTAGQAGTPYTLTDASTISIDLSTGNNLVVTLSGNRTLGTPTNIKVGQVGSIDVWQDGTGSRTLAYAWPYVFTGGTAPILTTTKYANDMLPYKVQYYATSSSITATNATPGVFTWSSHGLISGEKIQFTAGTTTTPSLNTTYFVNVVSSSTFNISSSLANLQAGTYVTTSGTSGSLTATSMAIFIGLNGDNR